MADDVFQAKDELELAAHGYKQELPRVLHFWTNWAIGFAFISPIVGLYTVLALNASTTGPTWVWTVIIAGLGQLLVAATYTQLAAKWPLAGGIYQWTRRLHGPVFGWWSGWIYIWALIFTLSLVAYGGGIFLAELVGVHNPSPSQTVAFALVVMAMFTTINIMGVQLLRFTVNIGIICELIGSIGIGVALLLMFRIQPIEVVVDTSYLPDGVSFGPAFIAAIAIAGWNYLGFDSCGALAEETQDPSRRVPKAIMTSIISIIIVNTLVAFAVTLAMPDLRALVDGKVADPVATAVVNAFGPWAFKPLLVIIVISFVACGIAVQGATVRVVYSFARDRMLPGWRVWSKVAAYNGSPVNAVLLVAALSSAAFLFANVLSVLAGMATGGYFIGFLCPVFALFIAQIRKRWKPGRIDFGRKGILLTTAALAWLIFETINIAIPRNPDLPWHQNWAVVLGISILAVAGAVYYFSVRPDKDFGKFSENEHIDLNSREPRIIDPIN